MSEREDRIAALTGGVTDPTVLTRMADDIKRQAHAKRAEADSLRAKWWHRIFPLRPARLNYDAAGLLNDSSELYILSAKMCNNRTRDLLDRARLEGREG